MRNQETSNTKSWFKRWWAIVLYVIVALIVIFSIIGSGPTQAEIDGEKVDYDELKDKVMEKENKLQDENDKLADVEEDLSDNEDEYEEAQGLVDDKDDIQEEIDEKEDKLSDAKDKIDKKQDKIEDKEDELDSIKSDIKEKEDDPVELGAGEFEVGSDVPENRYKAMPVGEGSNFIVMDNLDTPKVNTILGEGSHDESSYVFEAKEGDTIETHSSVKLQPVEE